MHEARILILLLIEFVLKTGYFFLQFFNFEVVLLSLLFHLNLAELIRLVQRSPFALVEVKFLKDHFKLLVIHFRLF